LLFTALQSKIFLYAKHANDMVKEKNFQTITVVDDKGIVVSSTNKKLESKSYALVDNAAYL